LIAAEIGEHQEQPADESRPERVGLFQIEGRIDGGEFSGRAREMERIGERDFGRKFREDD
jgi:hypothetical protein